MLSLSLSSPEPCRGYYRWVFLFPLDSIRCLIFVFVLWTWLQLVYILLFLQLSLFFFFFFFYGDGSFFIPIFHVCFIYLLIRSFICTFFVYFAMNFHSIIKLGRNDTHDTHKFVYFLSLSSCSFTLLSSRAFSVHLLFFSSCPSTFRLFCLWYSKWKIMRKQKCVFCCWWLCCTMAFMGNNNNNNTKLKKPGIHPRVEYVSRYHFFIFFRFNKRHIVTHDSSIYLLNKI